MVVIIQIEKYKHLQSKVKVCFNLGSPIKQFISEKILGELMLFSIKKLNWFYLCVLIKPSINK